MFLRSEINKEVSTVNILSTGKCPLLLGDARGGSRGKHTETSGQGSPRKKGRGLDQDLVKGLVGETQREAQSSGPGHGTM